MASLKCCNLIGREHCNSGERSLQNAPSCWECFRQAVCAAVFAPLMPAQVLVQRRSRAHVAHQNTGLISLCISNCIGESTVEPSLSAVLLTYCLYLGLITRRSACENVDVY